MPGLRPHPSRLILEPTDSPVRGTTLNRVWLVAIIASMAMLAGCGIWAILQDRRWVEEEASERARGIADLAIRGWIRERDQLTAPPTPAEITPSSALPDRPPSVAGQWISAQSQWPRPFPNPPIPLTPSTAPITPSASTDGESELLERTTPANDDSNSPPSPPRPPVGFNDIQQARGQLTESGIPVTHVLWARQLLFSQELPSDISPSELLRHLTVDLLDEPSALTQAILDSLPETTPALASLKQTLITQWEEHQRAMDWLSALRTHLATLTPQPDPTREHWLRLPTAWIVQLTPRSPTPPDGPAWTVQFHREEHVVGRLLATAQDWQATLPSHLGAHVSLGEIQITLSRGRGANPPTEASLLVPFPDDRWIEQADGPFRVQVGLTSQNGLYQRQFQRAWILGGILGFGVLVTLLGVMATARGMRQQAAFSQRQTDFVSSVSHELRAPLASMRLLAENLARGTVATDRAPELHQLLVQETRRLGGLVQNVLEWSRIEQGRRVYEREVTDVARLTQATGRLMEPLYAERNITLEIHGSETTIEANVDGQAIQQALVNLLDNALKHAPKNSTVRLALSAHITPTSPDNTSSHNALSHGRSPDFIYWEVQDSGPGIEKAMQQRIFDKFQRLGTELRRETSGIGIGLSLVRHIVHAHGGRVWVESEPGQGATFHIEIPITHSST